MEPKPEVEYYSSNAGAHAPLKILVQVTGGRWRVEALFADCKSYQGLGY